MRKLKQNNKGITLIALVVTIVVLLILAGITVGTLTSDNGIINEAKTSKSEVEYKALEEQVEAAIIVAEQKYRNPTLEQVIAEIKKNKVISTESQVNRKTGDITSDLGYVISGKLDDYVDSYTMEEAIAKGKFDKKTKIQDTNGKKLVIPAGFQIAEDSAKTVEEGIVIEDTTENKNQFVWVPVDNMETFKRVAGYSNGSEQSYDLTKYTEPYADGYRMQTGTKTMTEVSDYNDMCESVRKNKGFYIGRFEAGKDSSKNVVVKKGADVYNNVPWGNAMDDIEGTSNTGGKVGAVKLSKEFAMNNNYEGVISTLCYGIQWDATLKFIDPRFTGFAKDSSKQGWYSDNYKRTNTENNTTMNESHKTGIDLIYSDNLNVANKKNNIYDMAGNVWEWTMEAYATNTRVARGGSYADNVLDNPASYRYRSLTNLTYDNIGFRIALYLNE